MRSAPEKYIILSLDGSQIIGANRQVVIRDERGDIVSSKFEGYLDYSLETIKLEEVYNKHKAEFATPFAFLPHKEKTRYPYTIGLINVAFEHTYKPKRDEGLRQALNTIEIRNQLYRGGFSCDGIHYVRYKRSAGSSREGHCLFIPKILYEEMMTWSRCGIDSAIDDQASFQAYIALTLSSIEATIPLSKKAILVLKDDQVSALSDEEDAILVGEDSDGKVTAVRGTSHGINNTIWDGEALLDESVFTGNGYGNKGMMLLRNRFFKTCAFNTKLQQWFADNGITDINQLNGYYRRGAKLEDIKLVITKSSLKYCKMFSDSYLEYHLKDVFNQWLDEAFEGNTSLFGLVKTEKGTGLIGGRMVRTNYQLLNTLGLSRDESKEVLHDSIDYLHHILVDPLYMRHYISLMAKNIDADDDLDVMDATTTSYRANAVLEILRRCDDFAKTKFYCDFRGDVRDAFKRKLKKGRILVDGTYATLFGNGAEFLQAVIDKGYHVDNPIALKGNEIYSTRFEFGQELLCARSPHITMGNIFVAKNADCDIYHRYFNLTNEIVCINAIKHNIQQRLNGCDYDSDTMLITDNPILLAAAQRNMKYFPVPVLDESRISKNAETYDSMDPLSMAKLDRLIAHNQIGAIVNLSQYLNSLYWDRIAHGGHHTDSYCQELYADICKLAVLSGLEIDKAKHSTGISTGKVVVDLQKKYKSGVKMPNFYTFITANIVEEGNEAQLDTTMSYIFDIVNRSVKRAPRVKRIPLSMLVNLNRNDSDDSRPASRIIANIEEASDVIKQYSIRMRKTKQSEKLRLRELMDDELENAKKYMAKNLNSDYTLGSILDKLDSEGNEVSSFYALLFATLLFEEKHRFLERVIQSSGDLYNLELLPEGADYPPNAEIHMIYGHPHIAKLAKKDTED